MYYRTGAQCREKVGRDWLKGKTREERGLLKEGRGRIRGAWRAAGVRRK